MVGGTVLVGTSLCGLAAEQPPNILFYIGDNWSWPHASALGDTSVTTPVFDRVAKEGVLFSHAFCPVPSCSPTRSCIVTGRAAHQLERGRQSLERFSSQVSPRLPRRFVKPATRSATAAKDGPRDDFSNTVGQRIRSVSNMKISKPFWPPVIPVNHSSSGMAMSIPHFHRWRYDPESWQGIDPASLRIPPELPRRSRST